LKDPLLERLDAKNEEKDATGEPIKELAPRRGLLFRPRGSGATVAAGTRELEVLTLALGLAMIVFAMDDKVG